jgi:CRISP-associated protein Cas1
MNDVPMNDLTVSLAWTTSTATPAARSQPLETRQCPPEGQSRFLHVTEQGTMLRRAGTRVLITRKEEVLLDVPAAKLQGVLLYGSVQVSTHCLRNLLEQGCWLSFLTRNGVYKGRLQPPQERGGGLRYRQWDCSRDPAFALNFAKAVVRGKILAARQLGADYLSNYPALTLGDDWRTLRDAVDRVNAATDIDGLRGTEGAATRAYFGLFRRLNRSDFPFEGREKRGATDAINVLLNFGYTLLTRELEGLLESAGFDPTVGFYHAAGYDRPSLACDWVEEFRHAVVDKLVLGLINRASIQPRDFEEIPDKGLRLKPDALKKFVASYERKLMGKGSASEASAPEPYRVLFLRQLGRLLDAVNGRGDYRPHMEA